MSSKNKLNNSNQSKLLVESFELDNENQVLIAEGIDSNSAQDNEFHVEVALCDFEKWLDKNNFLKGEGEDCTGVDISGEPVFKTTKWNFTMREILYHVSDWDANDLLSDFINETQKFKELSK